MNPADVNLYLVGFMGSGKSTVGWQVAKALRFQFLDSDKEIEKRAGRAIADIFAQDGEPAFRARAPDGCRRSDPRHRASRGRCPRRRRSEGRDPRSH